MRKLSAAVVCLLLTGCVAPVPTSGPVEQVPVSAQPRSVEIAPEPPAPGMNPTRVVEGFLQAMADPDADYSVARQYLTKQAAGEWVPTSGARIHTGGVQEVDGAYRVQGTQTGSLDASGRFRADPSRFSVDLGLVQEDGEWRISTPPEGVLISSYLFERFYVHTQVYFVAGDRVVPELLHVPQSLLTPARVVNALISGPGPDLVAHASTMLPKGTQLAAEGATVDSEGTAHVALEGLPTSMSRTGRTMLGAQLLWSLSQTSRVSAVEITNNNEFFPLPGQSGDGVMRLADVAAQQPVARLATSDLFAVRDNVAGRFTQGAAFVPMESSQLAVAEVAVSLEASTVGFIDAARQVVLVGPLGGQQIPVVAGLSDLRQAQFVRDELWMLGTDGDGHSRLLRIDSRGRVRPVDWGDSVPGEVIGFAAPPGGVRVALITRVEDGTELGLTLLHDDADTLTNWRPMRLTDGGSPVNGITHVVFSGEAEMAVVAAHDAGFSVHRVGVDGASSQELGPPGRRPVQLAALPALETGALVALTDDGRVLGHEGGTRWSTRATDVSQVAYPG